MPSLTSIKSSIVPQPTIIAGHTAQLPTIIAEHITNTADQTTIDVQFGTSEERIMHDQPIINNEQTPLPTRRNRRLGPYNISLYLTNFGSSAGSSSSQPPIFELKHPFIFDLISGNYDISLWDAFRSWVRDGLLTKHDKKHIDVIFYYLRKKAKYEIGSSYKYTTVDCVFSLKISSIWEKYLDLDNDVGCADEEHVIGEYIRGYIMHAAIPWHMVDHVFVHVHVKNKFHWVLAVISLNDKRINVYDSYRAAGHDAAIKTEIVILSQLIPLKLSVNDYYKNKEIDVSQAQEENEFFDIVFIDNVPQQTHGTL
ncbi:hypothetical protein MTR67_004357 [Solanum verrucosum]|uniref:Ubiquitin-like protease family profile domain-containing protein n=1 Tax=Solanum verrucosum TaxID=315347 RepID=A0AAF0T7Q1_SOLVR|nr:hypothetical protein MTR67_004357 [Solanum verrucosum]